MAQRIYISKLTGDGLTIETAFQPAWREIIGDAPQESGAIDSVKYNVWVGTLDTDTAQHDLLVADNRVRHIPNALMNKRISELTTGQKTAAIEIFTYLGLRTDIFANTAKVKDILIYVTGRICWNPVKLAVEAIG